MVLMAVETRGVATVDVKLKFPSALALVPPAGTRALKNAVGCVGVVGVLEVWEIVAI